MGHEQNSAKTFDSYLTNNGYEATRPKCKLFNLHYRKIIHQAVNAVNEDAVIFVSSGVTGAIHKLIHGMNLKDTPVCTL